MQWEALRGLIQRNDGFRRTEDFQLCDVLLPSNSHYISLLEEIRMSGSPLRQTILDELEFEPIGWSQPEVPQRADPARRIGKPTTSQPHPDPPAAIPICRASPILIARPAANNASKQ